MAKKKKNIPQYGTVTRKGVLYYRTRILDADGKQVSLYGTTCEELYDKEQEARRQVAEIIFHREHPTVAEYCEKWLLMQSAKVSPATLKGYASNMKNYIIKPLGDMYMEEVTADDIRLALIPLSNKSESLHNTVNMLLKCIFYSAERSQLLEYNPCEGISAKGGKPTQKKDSLTDQQVEVLLETVKGLPPYLFTMIGLYAGLRREEALALQWDCVFLDAPTPYISVRRAWRSEHNRPVISTTLKTKAARRDIPIPKCLVNCLREAKAASKSEYVIADSEGQPLSYSQFKRVWQYIVVRSTKERTYKMKLEAIKRQAGRPGKNSAQLGQNFEGKTSRAQIAENSPDSSSQIQRYIRLNELEPELLQLVDEGKIGMTPAVEISYLKPDEQRLLIETIDSEQATPSFSQAQRMRRLSGEGKLNDDTILGIMLEQKKPENWNLTLPMEKIRKYFPRSYTPQRMEETILKLLESWMRQQKRQRDQQRYADTLILRFTSCCYRY